MVNNGYIIESHDILDTVAKLRFELTGLQQSLVAKCVAREVEFLQDMAFTLGAKFDKPIIEVAQDFVQGRIEGVRSGLFCDPMYDFRSSLSFCKFPKSNDKSFSQGQSNNLQQPSQGQSNNLQQPGEPSLSRSEPSFSYGKSAAQSYLVLFNCLNEDMISYFETMGVAKPYKFDPLDKSEENIQRGTLWQAVLEQANWNASAIGCSANLTFQPKLSEWGDISAKIQESGGYRAPEERKESYCRTYVIKKYVADLIGNADIAQISPLVLTNFYERAFEYLQTDKGKYELKSCMENWNKAFQPINSTITNA